MNSLQEKLDAWKEIAEHSKEFHFPITGPGKERTLILAHTFLPLLSALQKAIEQRNQWMKQAIETAAQKEFLEVKWPAQDEELLKILEGGE